jgi:hypothetical protein
LFCVDGEIITDFDMKFTPPLPRLPVPQAEALNRLARGLENEKFIQRKLSDLLGSRMGRLIAILLLIVTVLLLIYGMRKFMEGRHRLETQAPTLLGPSPSHASNADRHQTILRQGDFRTAARRLALDWLQQDFDVTPDRWLVSVDAGFQATGSLWSRWRLERQANAVLDLARAGDGPRLSRHQFFAFVESLRSLSAAVQAGDLALLVGVKNVRQS